MGSIAVIGLGKGFDRNPAPGADYTTIYTDLGGQNGGQSLTNRFIIINAGGEAVPYSDQLRMQFTPQIAADHVKKGGIWVDYCGAPMYYTAQASGQVSLNGTSGWNSFTQNLGYGWLSAASFIVNPNARIGSPIFPFVRGFPLAESLDGVCYNASGTFAGPGPFFTTKQWPLTANGYTAMFALRHPSGGLYCYATYWPTENDPYGLPIGPGGELVPGVDTSTYSGFIRNQIAGNTSGFSCRPYTLNTQYVPPATTSPSSPTKTTGSGSGSGSSNPTTTTTTTTTSPTTRTTGATTCPAGYTNVNGQCVPGGTPTWVKPALGIGILGIGGGIFYYAGKQEGWWGKHESNQ